MRMKSSALRPPKSSASALLARCEFSTAAALSRTTLRRSWPSQKLMAPWLGARVSIPRLSRPSLSTRLELMPATNSSSDCGAELLSHAGTCPPDFASNYLCAVATEYRFLESRTPSGVPGKTSSRNTHSRWLRPCSYYFRSRHLPCSDPPFGYRRLLPVQNLLGQVFGLVGTVVPPDSMQAVQTVLPNVVAPNRGTLSSFAIFGIVWDLLRRLFIHHRSAQTFPTK